MTTIFLRIVNKGSGAYDDNILETCLLLTIVYGMQSSLLMFLH
jgi:hypothetical protein